VRRVQQKLNRPKLVVDDRLDHQLGPGLYWHVAIRWVRTTVWNCGDVDVAIATQLSKERAA
jgi:hypothetical protein